MVSALRVILISSLAAWAAATAENSVERVADNCPGNEDVDTQLLQLQHGSSASGAAARRACFDYATMELKNQCPTDSHVVVCDGVTVIPSQAFRNCKTITDVTLPDTVTEFQDEAFYQCSNVETMNLPEGLKKIGATALTGLVKLEVTFPESLEYIGYHAMQQLNNTEIVLGPNVKDLIHACFVFAANLVTADFSRTQITDLHKEVIGYQPNLAEVILPGTLTRMRNHAGIGSKALKKITLPKAAVIETYAFDADASLDEVVFCGAGACPTSKPAEIPGNPTISCVDGCPVSPPAGGGGGTATAVGDPHVRNTQGEVFKIQREGTFEMLRVPEEGADPMLRALARVDRLGHGCAAAFFIRSVSMDGKWMEHLGDLGFFTSGEEFNVPASVGFRVMGQNVTLEEFAKHASPSLYQIKVPDFSVKRPIAANRHTTTASVKLFLGPGLRVKVSFVHERMSGDTFANALWLEASGLSSAKKLGIGGLLGVADHSIAATPEATSTSESCSGGRQTRLQSMLLHLENAYMAVASE